jgi:diguanylate cyclase (GGDEF)-like protein
MSVQAQTKIPTQLIISKCKELVARQLGSLLKDSFQQADQRLFSCARDAKSNAEQRDFFDASSALKKEQPRLESEIIHATLAQMDRAAEPADTNDKAAVKDETPGFSLLDTRGLEKLIAVARCVSKAETLHKILLHQLGQRFTHLLAADVDKNALPAGPAAICEAFSSVLTRLNLNWSLLKEIYEVLENRLIPRLGDLYANLNELLIQHGILPTLEQGRSLPRQNPPIRRTPPGPSINETTSPELHTPRRSEQLGAEPPNYGPGRIAPDSHAGNITQGAYQAAQSLWALQQHIQAGAFNQTAGFIRSPDTLEMPDMSPPGGTASPFYDATEIAHAIDALEPEPPSYQAGSPNIKDRLLSVLAGQNSGQPQKRLGQPQSMAIDMAADLLGSIDQDPLLNNTVKSQIRRLQFPICKVALSEPGFLGTGSHPVRQVLNQLAQLHTGPGNTANLEQLRLVIDRSIEKITHRSGQDPGVFAEVLAELNQLAAVNDRQCRENVERLVKECEQQQAFLKARRKDAGNSSDPDRTVQLLSRDLSPAVRAEWGVWLERAKELRVGDTLTLHKGPANAQCLGLTWIGEDHHPYVFADPQGKKACSMSLQELAMQLRSGTITLRAESLSAVDRALHSVLYKLHGQFIRQTFHDSLTGLENRKKFMERLEQAVLEARPEHTQHILVYLHLDKLDSVASKYGAHAHNVLLKRLAEILKRSLADRGALARVNEDEFAVLFEQCSLEEGRALAKRQIAALAKVHVRYKGQALTLGTSLGLVQVTAAGEEAEALLEAAASACWVAKAAGGNCLHEYEMAASEPIVSAQKQEVLDWQEWLAQALEGSGLALYCQRIAPLKQDRSLLPHYAIFPGSSDKDLGLIPPADLAPEFVSKVQVLDRRTIERVLRWMAIHQAELDNVGTYIT